ncbi:MAG: hypothetical protein WA021_05370 [Minisyncoccia bacterium]
MGLSRSIKYREAKFFYLSSAALDILPNIVALFLVEGEREADAGFGDVFDCLLKFIEPRFEL